MPQVTLSDLFNNIKRTVTPTATPVVASAIPTPVAPTTTIPSLVAAPTAPIFKGTTTPVSAKRTVTPTAKTTTTTALDYSKYTDPTTGTILTPQQYADKIITQSKQGDIPNYAGSQLTQGPQTNEQLTSTAAGLNNARNDIAVGATDPYKVASQSGVAYSPAELNAIEKAYAGIYDPAINSALSKLDTKQKADAAALVQKNDLAKLALQHQYSMAEKQAPTYADLAAAGTGAASTGAYTVGANPTVDGWVQSINTGKAKLSDMTGPAAKYKSAVANAMSQTAGTSDDMLSETKKSIDELQSMVDKDQGFSGAVGFGINKYLPSIFQAGTQQKDFQNKLDQVVNGTVIPNLGTLKGLGRVTQKEFDALKAATTALSVTSSESEFKKNLKDITDLINSKISKNPAASSDNVSPSTITAPDGTKVQIID